jgi:hypothetical protein
MLIPQGAAFRQGGCVTLSRGSSRDCSIDPNSRRSVGALFSILARCRQALGRDPTPTSRRCHTPSERSGRCRLTLLTNRQKRASCRWSQRARPSRGHRMTIAPCHAASLKRCSRPANGARDNQGARTGQCGRACRQAVSAGADLPDNSKVSNHTCGGNRKAVQARRRNPGGKRNPDSSRHSSPNSALQPVRRIKRRR